MANPPAYSTPRWVKVFGILALVLILLVVIMMMFAGIGGPHGPGRHLPSGDAGGSTLSSSVTEDPTPSDDSGGYTLPIEHGVQQP
jgi:hypothetical protein